MYTASSAAFPRIPDHLIEAISLCREAEDNAEELKKLLVNKFHNSGYKPLNNDFDYEAILRSAAAGNNAITTQLLHSQPRLIKTALSSAAHHNHPDLVRRIAKFMFECKLDRKYVREAFRAALLAASNNNNVLIGEILCNSGASKEDVLNSIDGDRKNSVKTFLSFV